MLTLTTTQNALTFRVHQDVIAYFDVPHMRHDASCS